MDNKTFLEQITKTYPSLKYFNIDNEVLILNYDKIYNIPFKYTNLANLNPVIFLLNPIELFQTLYIIELFYKQNLSEDEKKFIYDFVSRYLKLNEDFLANKNNEENRVYALSIPIYLAYDNSFSNTPCAKLIAMILMDNNNLIETGKSKGPKLVLNNSNFSSPYIEDDNDLEKAGFTTILLIVSAITITSLYIAFFIMNT